MKKEVFIGWDIGGAHLKYCAITDTKITCSVKICELWREENIDQIIDTIIEHYSIQGRVHNIITMSGEMCDSFENRVEGVRKILGYFKRFANSYVYTQNKGVISLKNNLSTQNIASSNWHVIAKYMSKKVKNAIIVDLGSTTTDFILVKNSNIINKRVSDFSGLSSKELLYTGCLRTPPYIFKRSFQINKTRVQIIPENFSSLADIYRITKKLPKNHYYCTTCDDKDRDIKSCLVRFARNFGLDYKIKYKKSLVLAASEIVDLHSATLNKTIDYHIKKNFLSIKNVKIIGVGIGAEIIKDICIQNHKEYLDLSSIMRVSVSRTKISPCHIAPAYFLANMLKEESFFAQN